MDGLGRRLREIGFARRPWHVGIGCVAAGLALATAGDTVVVGAATAALAVLAALRQPRLGALAALLVLAGATAGELRLKAIDAPALRVEDGASVVLRGHLLTPPRPNAFGTSAELRAQDGPGPLAGARLLLRSARWAPLPAGIRVGDELRVEGRLKELASEAAGAPAADAEADTSALDFARYLRARGVAAELLVERVTPTGRHRGGLEGALDGMRARAERAVVAGMSEPDAALLRGMVLGQDEAIDTATRDDFRDSGLAHLLAVSGQNVMLLVALALPALVLAGAGIGTRLAALAALVALYVPLAGAGPSLQRAGVMGIAGIAAIAASRPASRAYALLLAAAVTLAWNPRAWADPGWQLSFAAVAGILVLGRPLARGLRRLGAELAGPGSQRLAALGGVLADGVAITLAATVATAPLVSYHFGSIPLAGIPANVMALPAVAPAMWLGMLKIALGQAGDAGEPVAELLGRVAEPPVAYLAWLAARFADMPGGQVGLPLGSAPRLIGAYAVLAGLALLAARVARPAAPHLAEQAARWRRLPRARRTAATLLMAVALVAAAAEAVDGPDPPGRLTVRFLDVGQGDATLIQHPDGTAVLFDAGPPEAGVERLLRRAGVERLALVVATHASRDHHGGLEHVLRRFRVGALLDGGDGTRDPAFRAVLGTASERGVERVPALAPLGLALAGGRLRVHVLSPLPRPPGPAPEDPNPRAVVALVSAGAFDLLLAADAESESLLPLDLPDVDAMKVSHHGSADPGLGEVLDRLEPELAAIEVGPNTYGHPAPSTLTALRRADVTTYRTDRDGTVTVTVAGGEMSVETER